MSKITNFIQFISILSVILLTTNRAQAYIALEYDGTTYICDHMEFSPTTNTMTFFDCHGYIEEITVSGSSGGGGGGDTGDTGTSTTESPTDETSSGGGNSSSSSNNNPVEQNCIYNNFSINSSGIDVNYVPVEGGGLNGTCSYSSNMKLSGNTLSGSGSAMFNNLYYSADFWGNIRLLKNSIEIGYCLLNGPSPNGDIYDSSYNFIGYGSITAPPVPNCNDSYSSKLFLGFTIQDFTGNYTGIIADLNKNIELLNIEQWK
ncbi:hypothetical protein [uncultured Draconibacterium sp.]|uniref:hypothetical protein n=1 Tax=uncultured Draconibacterium sp. TaxID=1573823 RepID=UPI00326075B3